MRARPPWGRAQNGSAPDSRELFRRWRTRHDRRDRDELVVRFLPLARKLAYRYRGAHEPYEDLVQVASLGLVKAVDRFEPDRGTAFSSFAVPTIQGELKRYFRNFGWAVHVPRGPQERALKVEAAQEKLTVRHGRPPTVAELAERLELSPAEVGEALEAAAAHHAASLDAPSGDRDDAPVAASLGAEDQRLENVAERLAIAAAARQLPAQERRVLKLRFVDDLTQAEIGDRVGVSQMQVSRIIKRALECLSERAVGGAATP